MVSRDTLIDYLLHRMPDEEREAFAERWFLDPELHAEVRAAEAELLDAYARGAVSPEERSLIEQWLLGSDQQRRKLEFAQALAAALPAKRRRTVNWAALGAMAAAVLLLAGLSVEIARNRRLEGELAQLQTAKRAEPEPQPSAGVYAFFLPAGTLRSAAGTRLNLPEGANLLHLQAEIESGQEHDFDSAVLSLAGREIWRQKPVAIAKASASLWIPTALLAPGNYTLKLESQGTPVAYYSFTLAAPAAH